MVYCLRKNLQSLWSDFLNAINTCKNIILSIESQARDRWESGRISNHYLILVWCQCQHFICGLCWCLWLCLLSGYGWDAHRRFICVRVMLIFNKYGFASYSGNCQAERHVNICPNIALCSHVGTAVNDGSVGLFLTHAFGSEPVLMLNQTSLFIKKKTCLCLSLFFNPPVLFSLSLTVSLFLCFYLSQDNSQLQISVFFQ